MLSGESIKHILLKKWQDRICDVEITMYVYVENRVGVKTVKSKVKAKDF